MKGSIRVAIGFLIVFGSVGGMDADPSASILLGLATAVLGLGIMYSGVTAMNKDNNHG